MLKLEITGSNGRKYQNIGDMLADEVEGVLSSTYRKVERAIQAEHCPTHHQRPAIKRRKTKDGVTFEFECCCEKLDAQAKAAASRALR
ncbi:MAG TPA: hypothetical protein VES65_07875 [Solirubrobacteraceae bacterium]|nr:hypothetical protein [Solirubrobacteraceae bacterium]